MQILCIGDVVGSHGCDFLRRTLPAFKRTKGIDHPCLRKPPAQ